MLTNLQYRLLLRVAPRLRNELSGSAYQDKSKIRVLLGDSLIAKLNGAVVIDFGCGDGEDTLEIARSGATKVIGIDIRESAVEASREAASRAGLDHLCEFCQTTEEKADAIVSLDAFEHFSDPAGALRAMHGLLKPGGFVAASFGPTWYHPYGGHLFSIFPWAHLIFSEEALIRWRSHFRSDGATRFGEVEGGLNQMTIARFERLVKQSDFDLERLEAVPIRRLARFHNRFTREFTSAIVRCTLRSRHGNGLRSPA